jgi:hypothetical protein
MNILLLCLVLQSATDVKAVHRDGQTFVTWKDAAEGEAGSRFRYALYRSDRHLSRESLAGAELCSSGVMNNSAKLFGAAFTMVDRLDPTLPTCILQEGGKPLPMWSGLAVRTVRKDGRSWYAVVVTDPAGKPIGSPAFSNPVDETVAPIQPIKLGDSATRGDYAARCRITGKEYLPLSVNFHDSQPAGGDAGDHGDLYLYFGTPEMGWRDGLPGLFTVREDQGRELQLYTRDCIENPSGDRPIETAWFGYSCVPVGAAHREPRAYPFTERRLRWMVHWVVESYCVDPNRVTSRGQGMGAMGATQWAFRSPDLFAAVYPTLGQVRPSWLPALAKGRGMMEDGATEYVVRQDSVKWVSEHPEDLPFIAWGSGRQELEIVKALTDQKHGFAFAWNVREGAKAIKKLMLHYGPGRFARDRSYPAFGNSSIDDDPVSGEGGINLGFHWGEVIDEPGRWEAALWNDLNQEEMTVDVTPRRCRKFKARPGEKLKWTDSLGGSGDVVADDYGRVTVRKVRIQPRERTALTFSR